MIFSSLETHERTAEQIFQMQEWQLLCQEYEHLILHSALSFSTHFHKELAQESEKKQMLVPDWSEVSKEEEI